MISYECKTCKNRFPACSDVCESYKRTKQINEEIKAKERKEKISYGSQFCSALYYDNRTSKRKEMIKQMSRRK